MNTEPFVTARCARYSQVNEAISEYQNGLITIDELTDTLESLRIHLKKIDKDQREYERIMADYPEID